MTDFPSISYTSTGKIPTLSYTWSLKKVSLSGGASPLGHYREYPLPLIQSVQLNEALQSKQGFAEYVEDLKKK